MTAMALYFESPLNLPIKPDKATRIAKTKDPQTTSTTKPGDKAPNVSRWKQTSTTVKTSHYEHL